MKKTLAMLFAAVLLVAAICAPHVAAQQLHEHQHRIGFDTGIWAYNRTTDYHKSIVRVAVGQAAGTGTILRVNRDKPSGDGFQGHCVTAYHVVRDVPPGKMIRVHYTSGRTAKDCKVVAFDAEYDVALLWVWVPEGVTPARLATVPIQGRDVVEFCGLGGNSKLKCCLRSFSAHAALPTTGNQLYADVSLLPGDSGGPVFNAQRELVGVISGGWFWWEGGVRDNSGTAIMATWPARAANRDAVQRLLDQVDGAQPNDRVQSLASDVVKN